MADREVVESATQGAVRAATDHLNVVLDNMAAEMVRFEERVQKDLADHRVEMTRELESHRAQTRGDIADLGHRIERQILQLDGKIGQQFTAIGAKLDSLTDRIGRLEGRVAALEADMATVQANQQRQAGGVHVVKSWVPWALALVSGAITLWTLLR